MIGLTGVFGFIFAGVAIITLHIDSGCLLYLIIIDHCQTSSLHSKIPRLEVSSWPFKTPKIKSYSILSS